MARQARFRFSQGRQIDVAFRCTSEAAEAGVVFNTGQGANGRYVTVDGARLLNFGSCSYMALEAHPEIRDGAHRALDEYGTQFSFSRAYLQCGLYTELEELLEQITGRPVLVGASTSLAHMAALPVLISDQDHIIIDQFAHASVHTATRLVPDVPLEILRHNRMDLLDARLEKLRGQARQVWYLADGLYSMLGDYGNFAQLRELLDRHEHLHLYIDDAHAVSWAGKHGRGVALEHFADHERVVVALSLNKAFSAAGGVLAVPNRAMATRIRRCGGTLLFSGPVQPPMLGAAVASARLHLSEALPAMQAELRQRLGICAGHLLSSKLGFGGSELSPIFQLECDSPRVAFRIADRMKQKGFYCCVCVFPAVPINRPGIRFTISRHNEPADIALFVRALDECRTLAMSEIARSVDTAVQV